MRLPRRLEQHLERRALIKECRAFVRGRYAELHWPDDVAPPSWAWLNTLAHGSRRELQLERHRSAPECDARRARCAVIDQLLELLDQGHELPALQRQLVGLELDMAGISSPASDVAVAGVVAETLADLLDAPVSLVARAGADNLRI